MAGAVEVVVSPTAAAPAAAATASSSSTQARAKVLHRLTHRRINTLHHRLRLGSTVPLRRHSTGPLTATRAAAAPTSSSSNHRMHNSLTPRSSSISRAVGVVGSSPLITSSSSSIHPAAVADLMHIPRAIPRGITAASSSSSNPLITIRAGDITNSSSSSSHRSKAVPTTARRARSSVGTPIPHRPLATQAPILPRGPAIRV